MMKMNDDGRLGTPFCGFFCSVSPMNMCVLTYNLVDGRIKTQVSKTTNYVVKIPFYPLSLFGAFHYFARYDPVAHDSLAQALDLVPLPLLDYSYQLRS